jgi:sterol desaturase/sphingolipid hydroxylase (fatty acid hydroxylase superfamily)
LVYTAAYLTALAEQLAWFGAVVALIAIAERRWPAGPPPQGRDRVRNLLLVLVVSLALAAVLSAAAFVPDALVANGLIGVVPGGWHPRTLPALVAATLAYAFVWDVFQYWSHRAQHRIGWLWPAHALHHDDDRLNATTAVRNTLWSGVVGFLLVQVPTLIICGVNLLTIYAAYALFATWGFVNHANVRLSLGPLTPIVSGPQLHRIHHGRAPDYHDRNYAAFFPVIDVVFGTYRAPERDEFPATGLDDRAPRALGPAQLALDMLGVPPQAGGATAPATAPAPAGD